MKNIFIILLIVVFTACKSETKEEVTTETTPEPVEKEFTFSVSFKTNKSDVFKLMMNNVEVDELQKKNIQVFETIHPTTTVDMFTAKFGNMSKNIHFNLGNKEEKEIEIDNIQISYGNSSVTVKPAELNDYFLLNKFVTQDQSTFKIQTKKIDNAHYPTLILRAREINKLIKE